MKLEVDENRRQLTVTLSCRNLRALLHKAERMGDSACTIFREDAGWQLIVTSELDEQHYCDRLPGPMHPLTERALKEGAV